jgi:hypothetical protein
VISAQQVLTSIGARLRAEQLRRLDDLPPELRSRVFRALTVLPGDAAIDINRLVQDCQQQADEAQAVAETRPPPGTAWKFWLRSVATDAQARLFRDLIKAGRSAEAAFDMVKGAAGRAAAYVRPPREEPDDDDDTPPARRRITRLRAEGGRGAPGASAQPALQARPNNPPPAPPKLAVGPGSERSLGGRPLGCPVGADYGRWRRAYRTEEEAEC